MSVEVLFSFEHPRDPVTRARQETSDKIEEAI